MRPGWWRALSPRSLVRATVPLLLVPLAVLASVLAAAPWLRAFPVSVAGAPMYGAAVLSVLVPFVMARLRPRWFWLGIVVDLVAFVVYTLLVVLQQPGGFADLVRGFYDGPSQLLTFALPLVSPRSLMVAPVAVIWLAGALAGESIARRWFSVLPYLGLLVTFGLAYAGTQRAGGSQVPAALSRETLLAGGLLVTLLVMRVAQTWVREDERAETTQPDGVMPLRGLLVGTATAAVVAVLASLLVQAHAFPRNSHAPQRVPSVVDSKPLTPLAFIAGLRPQSSTKPGTPVFSVTTDKASSGYFEIANVDFYDGAGWSFTRTFRPSGGVLPDDPDTGLRVGSTVTQQYSFDPSALTDSPWMPYLYRAHSVTGASVNIDATSGMIVPSGQLRAGEDITVSSRVGAKDFTDLDPGTSTADTSTATIDTQVPGDLAPTLNRLVSSFSAETSVSVANPLQFLRALQRDLLSNYSLSGNTAAAPSGPASSGSGTRTGSAPSSPSPSSSSSRSDNSAKAGSTGFADVLGSILGTDRAGTPEQYATLVALVARTLNIPARVATGFRVVGPGATSLPAGRHDVTTADAWSWVEIPVVGAGWVVLDATPARASTAQQPSESVAPASSSSSAPPSQNAQLSQNNSSGNALGPKSPVEMPHSSSHDGLLIAILVAVGVLLVLLLALLLARKPLRASRRRRSADPRARVVGAWQESLDVFAEAGLPRLSAMTSTEIAWLAGEQFGPEAGDDTAALGSVATAVTYSRQTVIAPEQADDAWTRQRRIQRAVRGRLGVGGRLAAGLRYHRVRATPAQPVSPTSWAIDATERREQADRNRRKYEGRRRAH